MTTDNISTDINDVPDAQNLTNQVFHNLTVIEFHYKTKRDYFWHCLCVCGNIKSIRGAGLKNGHTKSCGCLQRKHVTQLGKSNTTHGASQTAEYHSFHDAKKRCENILCKSYPDYGARGIEFRLNNITELLDDIGLKPTPKYTLDRIDTDGHYEVGNIRWATRKIQNNNTRRNHFLTYNGKTQTAAEWSEEIPIKAATMLARVRRGWCIDCVMCPILGMSCAHSSPMQ